MDEKIFIGDLDKVELVKALHAGSRQFGIGKLQPDGLTHVQAVEVVASGGYIDYLNGRVMKVDVTGENLDPYLYDRDNGNGACERIVSSLRASLKAG